MPSGRNQETWRGGNGTGSMKQEKKLGEIFCGFYMKQIREKFEKFPEDAELTFCMGQAPSNNVICVGKRRCWDDSRLEAEEKKSMAAWLFSGKCENKASKYFMEMIIEELEESFKNLLYLETLEEWLEKAEEQEKNLENLQHSGVLEKRAEKTKKLCEDKLGRLIKGILGGRMDKEWLVSQFVRKTLREKGLPPLEFLIQVSAQKYERRIVETTMYFNKEKRKSEIVFAGITERTDKWKLIPQNLRAIRKIMEMSGSDNGLMIAEIQGEYFITGITSKKAGDLPDIRIEFTGHLSWSAAEGEQTLFEYREGVCKIPALEGGRKDEKWLGDLQSFVEEHPVLNKQEILDNVSKIVDILKEQKHGTSIVFMEDGILEKEKKRLMEFNRAYQVEAFPIFDQKEKMIGISAVDGAVIADIEGKCHLVGAILDCEAVKAGNSSRGARYNSLSNYVIWIHDKYKKELPENWCFAFVISEDETVDLVTMK